MYKYTIMAVLWYRNIQNLWCNVILRDSASSGRFGVTVYAGAQPAATTISSSWTSYNSNFLLHIDNVVISAPSIASVSPQLTLSSSASATAFNTGTASWAILWPTFPTQATIQGSSLPSTRFLVVPVSSSTGTGVVRFTSTSIVSGNSYSVTNFTMLFSGGST